MREQVVDVPPQEVITEDNVVVSVDAVVYHEATDPKRLVYNVADFLTATTKLAQTNLRNLIGDLELDKALTGRDEINAKLREVLDVATDKWGVRMVRVEIQRIDPPTEVVSAMHAQMRAERDRRATVTEANGYREAAVARANGEKEAAVLTVEYLDALERIGDGRATKLVIPAEFSGLLGTVTALAEAVRDDDDGDEVRPRDGLSVPDDDERVDLPPPAGAGS